MSAEWIGVDLDGTLAFYDGWQGADHIGKPVPAMVARVKGWLLEGKTVKIFTARVCRSDEVSPASGVVGDEEFVSRQVRLIQDWCEEHIGQRLEVTAIKDYLMVELWDDRAFRVVTNTGRVVGCTACL